MKYKKKPVAIEAFEEGILYFDALTPDTPPIELFIKTLEGTMHAPVGSYVIQGVRSIRKGFNFSMCLSIF